MWVGECRCRWPKENHQRYDMIEKMFGWGYRVVCPNDISLSHRIQVYYFNGLPMAGPNQLAVLGGWAEQWPKPIQIKWLRSDGWKNFSFLRKWPKIFNSLCCLHGDNGNGIAGGTRNDVGSAGGLWINWNWILKKNTHHIVYYNGLYIHIMACDLHGWTN